MVHDTNKLKQVIWLSAGRQVGTIMNKNEQIWESRQNAGRRVKHIHT